MPSRCQYKPGLYAAVDIGTVTCRLFIARIDAEGSFEEIVRETNICNLGVGVDSTHRLDEEAIERTVAVLCQYSSLIEATEKRLASSVLQVRVVATSASRDAENAVDFQQKVKEQTLFELEVIPGTQEAALSFKGASSVFPGEQVVVIDIGGGSTEIVAGLSGHMPQYAQSFDIGCRRITERFLLSDPPLPSEIDTAREYITQVMELYLSRLQEEGAFAGLIVAVAGTATSAVSMRENMVHYDPQKVHGVVVSRADVNALFDRLKELTLEQRKRIVGLEPARAGVVVAGLLIMQTIMKLVGAKSFTVSECDILQGIVLDKACS